MPVRRWLVVMALLVVAGVVAAWFTPLLAVRNVTVTGTSTVSPDAVRSALALGHGTPLLQVDLDAAARRVSTIPRVQSAQVRREFPSSVEVVVIERRVTLLLDEPDGVHQLDAGGVDFAVGDPPGGVPTLITPTPGVGDAATSAALQVVTALTPSLAAQTVQVRAPSPGAVSLGLSNGRTVVFGSADQAARKAAVATVLLSQPGDTADVTSPDLPTLK